MKVHFLTITVIGIACIYLLTQCTPTKNTGGGKYKYDRFQTSDFPSYVESIIFSNGSTLSATSSIASGSWKISFPRTGSPIAKGGGSGDIYMTGFIATNPVEGEFSCTIAACKACAYTGEQADRREFIRRCRIVIGEDAKNYTMTITINCPVDIRLR